MRIALSDWVAESHPTVDRMIRLLAARLPAERASFADADLLVYSDFGERHWGFQGPKVYLTGENMLPDFDQCDLAYTPAEIPGDARAIRFPYFAQVLPGMGSLVRDLGHDPSKHLDREGFACFVASNPRGAERNRFFKSLRRRRPVVSAGRHFNTTGKTLADKMELLRGFRFNLAFENSRSPGYVTEKLIEPLMAGTIPIYWGAPDVGRDFNPECMIDVSTFPEHEAAIDHLLAVDADPASRLKLLSATPFAGNREPECLKDDYLVSPLIRLVESGLRPGKRRYRHRKLREHVHGSALGRQWESLRCRAEGFIWKLGWR